MRVRRSEVPDEVLRDGESVVLLAGRVLHVSELGTLVRRLTPEWTELSTLTGALEAAVGAPEDGDTAGHTETLLRELAGTGLVELDPS